MKHIILDRTLQPAALWKPVANNRMLEEFCFDYDIKNQYQLTDALKPSYLQGAGIFGALRTAYANHYAIQLTPDDILLFVLSQLAKYVKAHSGNFRKSFTTTNEKTTIQVPSLNEAAIPVALVFDALTKSVTFDTEMLMPAFSTTTKQSKYVAQCMMLEIANPFYIYSTFLCGIPEVILDGSQQDWQQLAEQVNYLMQWAGKHFKSEYLITVSERVAGMADSFTRSDEENTAFWKEVYQIGSEGCVEVINGWFTQLFYLPPRKSPSRNSDIRTGIFDMSCAIVPFTCETTGAEFIQITGGLHADEDALCNNTIKLQYDSAVLRKIKR